MSKKRDIGKGWDVLADLGKETPTPIVSDVDELRNKVAELIANELPYDDELDEIMQLITSYTHDRETEVRIDEVHLSLNVQTDDCPYCDGEAYSSYHDTRLAALKATGKDGI